MATRSEIEQNIMNSIGKLLKASPDMIDKKARFHDEIPMDSYVSLGIVVGIEERFDIEINYEDIKKIWTCEELITYVFNTMNKKK